MSPNRISATLAPTDRSSILQAIDTIRTQLPFLIDIEPTERQALPKLGDKSKAFVTKALELATQNQGFLPRDFDVEEMRKDVQLYEDLSAIRQALAKLFELVDDSLVVTGSEAYIAALTIYTYAKNSNVGTAGLDGTIDELGARFARKARSATPKAAVKP